MIEATCHCGSVRIGLPAAPATVTDCNCSICRRLGTLWAYYPRSQVIMPDEAATTAYVRADRPDVGGLAFHHCRRCGCATHWLRLKPGKDRMGVNGRLLEPALLTGVRVRRLDGADTWTYDDEAPAVQ